MFGFTTCCLGTLLAVVWAQTAPGFPISSASQLTIAYGNNTVSPPGELIPRGETSQPPRISTPVWTASESGPRSGVLLMVDLDVPRNGSRVQLVHWIAANITLAGAANASGPSPLNIPDGPIPYLQPSPPPGDSPHSYTFILFAQPSNFSIPAQYSNLAQNRVPFNTSQFVKDVGLVQALAANYIRVQNLTGTPTTTFPPARPTGSGTGNSSTPVPFPGRAQRLAMGGVAGWGAVFSTLFAGMLAVAL